MTTLNRNFSLGRWSLAGSLCLPLQQVHQWLGRVGMDRWAVHGAPGGPSLPFESVQTPRVGRDSVEPWEDSTESRPTHEKATRYQPWVATPKTLRPQTWPVSSK